MQTFSSPTLRAGTLFGKMALSSWKGAMSTLNAACWPPSITSSSRFPFQNLPQDLSLTTAVSPPEVSPTACSARTTRATVSGTPSPGCSQLLLCSSRELPELFLTTDSTGPKRDIKDFQQQKKPVLLRLDQARDYAAATGWSGARFPWESAFTGGEVLF